jgi:hypothetical protein
VVPNEYLTKDEGVSLRARETKRAIIDRELKAMVDQHGSVTARMFLDAARAETHPLHPYFEWNDALAAERHRLDQAYQMILTSKMLVQIREAADQVPTVITETIEVRQFVSSFRGGGFKFRPTVISADDERREVVKKKLADLRGWCDSVADIEECRLLRSLLLSALQAFPLEAVPIPPAEMGYRSGLCELATPDRPCVYFIYAGGRIKIGVALVSLRQTIKQRQTYCPHPQRLVGYVDGGREKETEMKDRFATLRVTGEWMAGNEWFDFSGELETFVREMNTKLTVVV